MGRRHGVRARSGAAARHEVLSPSHSALAPTRTRTGAAPGLRAETGVFSSGRARGATEAAAALIGGAEAARGVRRRDLVCRSSTVAAFRRRVFGRHTVAGEASAVRTGGAGMFSLARSWRAAAAAASVAAAAGSGCSRRLVAAGPVVRMAALSTAAAGHSHSNHAPTRVPHAPEVSTPVTAHGAPSRSHPAPGEPHLTVEEAKSALRHADAVVFDVDSTVIQVEGIDELAEAMGVGAKVAALTSQCV